VSNRRISKIQRVYNFTVHHEHLYRVGRTGVLVHNDVCKPGKARNAPRRGHSYPSNVTTNAARKAHRTEVARSTWTNHGHKHLQARTLDDAKAFSSNGGASQYVPGVNNKALEKLATQKGLVIEHGKTKYFFYKSDNVIGYDNGTATQWIRAEISSRVYHGHPMRVDRLPKAVRDAFGL
jgi:hypothetical protein